jgi:hypothetical protein
MGTKDKYGAQGIWEARTCIAIPNSRPSSGITNHDPDTASTGRPIPAAARWRIAVRVLSASAGEGGADRELRTHPDREAAVTCGGWARFGMSRGVPATPYITPAIPLDLGFRRHHK